VQFDVATSVLDGARATSISAPVAWPDPSDAAARVLSVGAEFLVVGSVRRRFFRVGGATQSRTEVVAERVVPLRRRKQVTAALADVVRRMGDG
jgi:single-strand DNA-binding protein